MPLDVATIVAPFPLPRSARLAVFASGRGSNLASLLAAFPPATSAGTSSDVPARVALVVSNEPAAQALERAAAAGVATHVTPWNARTGDRTAFEADVQRALDAAGIDVICLAGFMRILSPSFSERWFGRMLNVHPSLLPRHPGLHAQRQALDAGDAISGCTVHLVDAGVDQGPILLQRSVPILEGDTEERLADRILEQEHVAYPDALRGWLSGALAPMEASA